MKTGPRKFACCVICDTPVYEILRFDPETRVIRKVGAPLPGAVHLVWLQCDGRRVELSCCEDCRLDFLAQIGDWTPRIWRRVIEATAAARDVKAEPSWVEVHNKAILDLIGNPPIAYIGAKPLAG